jgi:hypothetical protein
MAIVHLKKSETKHENYKTHTHTKHWRDKLDHILETKLSSTTRGGGFDKFLFFLVLENSNNFMALFF